MEPSAKMFASVRIYSTTLTFIKVPTAPKKLIQYGNYPTLSEVYQSKGIQLLKLNMPLLQYSDHR